MAIQIASASCYICQLVPAGVQSPTLISQTPSSVLVSWTNPLHPNGDITKFSVNRKQPDVENYTVVQSVQVDSTGIQVCPAYCTVNKIMENMIKTKIHSVVFMVFMR